MMLRRYFDNGLLSGTSFVPSWAQVLGVSQKTMRKWASPDKIRASIAAGDLEALPTGDLAELLRFWLSQVEATLDPVEPAADPRVFVISLCEASGELATMIRKAVSDHRVSKLEWTEIAALLGRLETMVRRARLAAESAASAGGAR